MDKKVIFSGIVSLCSAKAAWQEIGREFKSSDGIYGEVGLLSAIGRFGLKASAAILAYVITDASITWTLKGISDAIKASSDEDEKEEDKSDLYEDTVNDEDFDEGTVTEDV